MRILRKFLVELILAGAFVGWLFWKVPEAIDPLMPWIVWAILAHLTWEIASESEGFKSFVGGTVERKKMTWLIAFLLGGIVSALYLWVAQRSVKGLLSVAESYKHGSPTTDSLVPHTGPPPAITTSKSEQPDKSVTLPEATKDHPAAPVSRLGRATRGPSIERTAKFTVMIPFDTTPGAFPIPTNENMADPLSSRYSEFYWLAYHGLIPQAQRETTETGAITINPVPLSLNDSTDFLARLLQYDIFHNIDSMQHDSMSVTLGGPTETIPGVDPPDAERYSYEKLFKELENNHFYRPFTHRPFGDDMTWKMKASKFPKEIEITFPADTTDPVTKYLVRFYRPHYYKADFTVEPFMGTKVGEPPKHFVSKNAAMIMQWSFFVKMHYRIEQPYDDEFNPGIYAQWLDALYDGLKKKLASD